MVDMLLDRGAGMDEETDEGLTPLLVAARSHRDWTVERLLARGAEVTARTRDGKTALLSPVTAEQCQRAITSMRSTAFASSLRLAQRLTRPMTMV